MKMPQLFHVDLINRHLTQIEINGMWVLARPLSINNFLKRIKIAYGVFIGKYDAIKWYKQ